MIVDLILFQQNQCYVRAMTSVTWRAVCYCSHKNEHCSTTGSIFACWGATSKVSKSSPWRDLCTLLAMMWQSKHAPTTESKVARFQEFEVNFLCFGHFGQIGEKGNLKSNFHFHSGVKSQLGFEFLLANLPQLLARTKTRGCLCLQPGRRKTNAPGYEHFFSGGCFFFRAFCHLVILLTSWVVKCQHFCQQNQCLSAGAKIWKLWFAIKVLQSPARHQPSWGSETLSQLDEEQPPSLTIEWCEQISHISATAVSMKRSYLRCSQSFWKH